jgi:type I restriction enzyme S subunit
MKKQAKWHISPLDELAKVERGRFSHRPRNDPAFYDGETPFIQTGDVSGAKLGVILSYSQSLNERGLKVSKVFPKGTLMVSIAANIGDAATLGFDSACPDSVIAITVGKNLSSDYLRYYLRSRQSWIKYLAPAGAQKNINVDFLQDIEVEYPPLPEQRKIADILSTWDETLTQLDSLIEAQERRKKALMQQLLTGKKRFPAFAKKPWKKVRMGEVLKRVFRPIDWSAEMSLSLISLRRRCGGLFRRPDVLGADYKTQDLHELHADDFLISKRQVAHGAWGLVTPEFAGSHVSKEYAILVNTAPEKLHMPFFAWLSQTPRMIRLSRVASTGVHIEKLIFDPVVFLRDSIRIPSDLEEQRQIATILDTADQQLTLLRTQRTALDQQKRGLMQRLLTGKLRVNA